MSAIHNEIAVFNRPAKENAIEETDWVEHRPSGAIERNSPLVFQLNGLQRDYILPSKCLLKVMCKVFRDDGTPLDATDEVALENLSLHTLFRQVDVYLQQQLISAATGVNYPYKAYIDVSTLYNHDVKDSQLQSEGYFKDLAGFMEDPSVNSGYSLRKSLTAKSNEVDFEGVLHVDIAQQGKAILNGVPLTIKLFQHDDKFRLFSPKHGQPNVPTYHVKITDAILKVCYIKLKPFVLFAHAERLKKSPAIYPYWRSDIKSFGIAAGSLTFAQDDIFQGLVPNKLVVAFVTSAAYSGDFKQNPFNFKNFGLNYLELAVDGRSLPTVPFQPKYAVDSNNSYLHTGYVTEYLSLFRHEYPQKSGNFINRADFPRGYAIYTFTIKPVTGEELYSDIKKGHTRLTARFDKALTESVTAIVYGVFPSEFRIDHTRNVLV